MWKKVIIVALTIMFLSPAFPLRRGMGDVPPTTTLSVEPQGTFGLALGNTFSINITVSNVTDLYAWQFALYYQNSVLNATTRFNPDAGAWEPNITEGPFLKTGSATLFFITTFTDNFNATYGLIWVSCTRLPPVNGTVPGVNGTGILATITFKVVGTGGSVLHLDNTKLYDSAEPFGHLIPHTPIDGQAYVGVVDVAVSEIDTPINIPKGTMAYVNVTAQNKGQIAETFDVTLYDDVARIETKTIVNLPGGGSQILPFAWDTTLIPTGEYNLVATATTVPGETDTSDNTISLLVYVGIRDLAITNLVSLKTVVGQGFSTPINVTVANQGQVSETSNITVYANQGIIATFEDITLTSGGSATFTFTWNTTVFGYGNYTMSAYVQSVPFETNTQDNSLTSPVTVMVVMPGDLMAPFGVIDMKDIAYVAKRFGTDPSKPLWDPSADFNGDGKVDMRDIAVVARNFGKHYL